MKIEYCHPDNLPFEALALIKKGLTKAEGNLNEILEKSLTQNGNIFLLHDNGVKGVLYFELCEEVLNLALMSCENTMNYKDLIAQFVKDLMKVLNVQNFCIVSRTGWNRLFKDLKPIGMIYTYSQ